MKSIATLCVHRVRVATRVELCFLCDILVVSTC